MKVRTLAIDIQKTSSTDWPETRRTWQRFARDIQEAHNWLWQTWLVWHRNNGSEELLKRHFDCFKAWQAVEPNDEKTKPEWPVQAFTGEMIAELTCGLKARFPTIHGRCLTLLVNIWQGNLKSRKAVEGPLPGWIAILFCQQCPESLARAQPIPFDLGNCGKECLQYRQESKRWYWTIRLDRIPRDGKLAISTPIVCELKAKSFLSRTVLSRIASGEYKFCGSSLAMKDGRAKLLICWKPADKTAVDDSQMAGTAFLAAGRLRPWQFRIGGRRWRGWGGDGSHVSGERARTMRLIRQRQHAYRWTSSSAKGHGRNRALDSTGRLRGSWSEFTKRANHGWSRELVNLLISRKIKRLVWFPPRDGDARFLAKAGQDRTPKNGTAWPWFQLKTLLAYKCQEAGIHFKVSEHDAKRAEQRAFKAEKRVKKRTKAASGVQSS